MQHIDLQTQTIYSELLVLCSKPVFSGHGLAFTQKKIKARKYWYLNITLGRTIQRYLGPDSPETREKIEQEKALWNEPERTIDRNKRAQLVSMFLAGGGIGLTVAEGKLLTFLERVGVFLVGGVLIGTPAFRAIGNNLGVHWDLDVRTKDVDIAADYRVPIAVPNKPVDLLTQLRESGMGFLAVPALDRRSPSTSFQLRDIKLSVDMLTPEIGKPTEKPIYISALKTYASPMIFLDYLLADVEPAILAQGFGVYVNVPNAARFAFHKCVISQRPGRQKAKKDLAQAEELLDVLVAHHPGTLIEAYEGGQTMGKKFITTLNLVIKRFPKDLKEELITLLEID